MFAIGCNVKSGIKIPYVGLSPHSSFAANKNLVLLCASSSRTHMVSVAAKMCTGVKKNGVSLLKKSVSKNFSTFGFALHASVEQ